MSTTVFWSLGYFRQQGYRITAYCEQHGPEPMCRHSADVDLDKAIAKFGPDFIISDAYPRFIASLKCAKCGSRQVSIQIGNPPNPVVTPAVPVWLMPGK